MTEVAHPPHEPGPWGHRGSVESMSDEETDWSVERKPPSQKQNARQRGSLQTPADDRLSDGEGESNSADTDDVNKLKTSEPYQKNEESSDESSSSPRRDDDDGKVDKRKKFDTPYPRIKSPTGSPRHSASSEGTEDEAPGSADGRQRNLSSGSQEDEEDEDDEAFEMTEDQKLAMKELQEMRLDLGYAADEDPPEYDVAERVRQLNEELANDPTPVEDDRERSIKFKSNLVDLVAPPPDVSESEEDSNSDNAGGEDSRSGAKKSTSGSGDSATGTGTATDSSNAATGSGTTTGSGTDDSTSGHGGGNIGGGGDEGDDDEKILVHRNGKFELTSAKDLSAEERQIYLGDDEHSLDSDTSPHSTESAPEASDDHEPRPPSYPRPRTAASSSHRNGRGQGQGNNDNRRAKSAEPELNKNRDCEDFNYTSPYAMTSDERKRKSQEQKEKQKQQKKDEDDKEKEEEDRKEKSESAFNAWLKKKKDEAAKRREEDKKRKQNGEEPKDKEKNSFGEWQQEKQKQEKQQKESEKKRHEEEERDQAWGTRTQQECDKAYKQWLRQKYQQWQKERKKDKEHTRICRLMERRSRKSLALANAITQAQSYRYIDNYGYRS